MTKPKTTGYAKRIHEANLRAIAQSGRSIVRRFLNLLGLGRNYAIRKVVLNPAVSNKTLQQLTGGYGYPDWRAERIEEKRSDPLSVAQWARAILELRADRHFKVLWRFSSMKYRLFQDPFAFYEWQLGFLSKKSRGKR